VRRWLIDGASACRRVLLDPAPFVPPREAAPSVHLGELPREREPRVGLAGKRSPWSLASGPIPSRLAGGSTQGLEQLLFRQLSPWATDDHRRAALSDAASCFWGGRRWTCSVHGGASIDVRSFLQPSLQQLRAGGCRLILDRSVPANGPAVSPAAAVCSPGTTGDRFCYCCFPDRRRRRVGRATSPRSCPPILHQDPPLRSNGPGNGQIRINGIASRAMRRSRIVGGRWLRPPRLGNSSSRPYLLMTMLLQSPGNGDRYQRACPGIANK